ncbi:MAG: iron ABC transporter permease [Candidatus Methanogranum gryphiswaldense]|nr:MAG: iron ABC transporter permease [Candidatus Methanogranum sp. U3.2.1]
MFVILCLVIAFLAMGLELSFGKYDIGFIESYRILIDHILGVVPISEAEKMKDYVIWDLRFPRAIAGLAVGAGLGVCGAAMQSALKNPLADPYTTGIASGASFGACLAIILGISLIPGLYSESATMMNAFIFALIPAAMIIIISKFKKNITPAAMVLIGIAVMYIFTAATTMLKVTASEESLAEIYIWNIGTLGKASWSNVWYMVVAALLGIIAFQILAKKLNVLVMCDQGAITLGVNPKKTRLITLGIVSLVTAVLVGFTGTIGFVGLVAPHVVRIFLGSDNKYLIPASAAFGAMMLLLADCIAKSAGSTGLPVGTITALIGGPLFLYLLIKQSKSAW